MSKIAPELVNKSVSFRLWELSESLRVIRDALSGLKQGQTHQVRALASQLRVLLTDRSKGSSPLLIETATLLKRNLSVYHGPAISGPDRTQPSTDPPSIFEISLLPITLFQEWDDQQLSDLTTVLKMNLLYFNRRAYSLADIVALFANTAGGAHAPRRWPRDLALLMESVQIGGAPAPVAILAQLGQAVQQIGVGILRDVGCIEVYCGFVIPSYPVTNESTLFHLDYFPNRGSLSITMSTLKRLKFQVESMHGQKLSILADVHIDWSRAHYLFFSQWLTDDLHTECCVVLDGYRVREFRVDTVFMLPSTHVPCALYVNRSRTDLKSSASVGLVQLYVTSASQPLHENAARCLELYDATRTEDSRCVYLRAGESGASKAGSQNLEFTTGAKISTIGEVLRLAEETEQKPD